MVGYLIELLRRFKVELGGGSALLLVAGLLEHYFNNTITWLVYSWLLTGCLLFTQIAFGAELHRSNQPRLKIHKLTRREWSDSRRNIGAEYYFEVLNIGTSRSIENVNVELIRLEPDDIRFLPVHMHIKHDNKPANSTEFQFATSFTLNPQGGKQVDLVTGPTIGSPHPLIIPHIVRDSLTTLPARKYDLHLRITGTDIPAELVTFQVWIDDTGQLQAIHL